VTPPGPAAPPQRLQIVVYDCTVLIEMDAVASGLEDVAVPIEWKMRADPPVVDVTLRLGKAIDVGVMPLGNHRTCIIDGIASVFVVDKVFGRIFEHRLALVVTIVLETETAPRVGIGVPPVHVPAEAFTIIVTLGAVPAVFKAGANSIAPFHAPVHIGCPTPTTFGLIVALAMPVGTSINTDGAATPIRVPLRMIARSLFE
jgi:hypothetical protein